MPDKYPDDLLAEIRSLRADVESLKAQQRQRSALTSASAGWIISNHTADSDDINDGGHLGASSNEPVWTEADGSSYSLKPPPPPEFPQAADVGGMSGLSTPNAWPSTYNPVNGESVQDDLEMIRLWVLQLRTNLRDAGIMA